MNVSGPELLESVRAKFGMPFAEHFSPNLCASGKVTQDTCMQKGLTRDGYDCSGLIVASLCEVAGIATDDWPRDYRHSVQLGALAVPTSRLNTGNVLYITHPQKPSFKHVGVVSGEHTYIHATPDESKGRVVVEEYIDYSAQLAVVDVDCIFGTLDN